MEGIKITEDEYWDSDPEFDNDGEFGDTFLHEENDNDISVIIVPKLDYDIDELLRGYLKTLKKCKSTDDALQILYELIGQIKILTIIEMEYEELQNKAHDLEELMEHVHIR